MLPDADKIMRISIDCCVYGPDAESVLEALRQQATCRAFNGIAALETSLQGETMLSIPEILLLEVDPAGACFELVERIRKNVLLSGLIIVMLAPEPVEADGERARQLRIHDFYEFPYPVADICERMTFLVKYKLLRPRLADLLSEEVLDSTIRMPPWKRAFDVAFSLSFLLLLAPLMLTIALLIRLESRGPVVYHSKRVGSGYKIFNFYKFRSMFPDADSRLAEFMSSNQYRAESGNAGVFVKLKNDPRITRVGRIIRKLSIDELPQLFNILRGDMSTVGNRPLPLYEAEQLTSNEWSLRFLAPSGLTGLWQISRRGRADMSERERKKLDNFYAKNYSLLFDLKILLKTLPAAFQRENV